MYILKSGPSKHQLAEDSQFFHHPILPFQIFRCRSNGLEDVVPNLNFSPVLAGVFGWGAVFWDTPTPTMLDLLPPGMRIWDVGIPTFKLQTIVGNPGIVFKSQMKVFSFGFSRWSLKMERWISPSQKKHLPQDRNCPKLFCEDCNFVWRGIWSKGQPSKQWCEALHGTHHMTSDLYWFVSATLQVQPPCFIGWLLVNPNHQFSSKGKNHHPSSEPPFFRLVATTSRDKVCVFFPIADRPCAF